MRKQPTIQGYLPADLVEDVKDSLTEVVTYAYNTALSDIAADPVLNYLTDYMDKDDVTLKLSQWQRYKYDRDKALEHLTDLNVFKTEDGSLFVQPEIHMWFESPLADTEPIIPTHAKGRTEIEDFKATKTIQKLFGSQVKKRYPKSNITSAEQVVLARDHLRVNGLIVSKVVVLLQLRIKI